MKAEVKMVSFKIYSVSAGQIEGKIIVGTSLENYTEYYFSYSYLSNFLDDLVKGLLAVNNSLEDNSDSNTFTAYWEPAIDDWKLEKQNEKLKITVISYSDKTRQEKKNTAFIECNYYKFVKAIITGLTELIKETGFYGYRTEWEKEFPFSLYLKLADIIQDKQTIFTTERSLEDTQGFGGVSSDYIAELRLLQANITSDTKRSTEDV